MKTAKVKNRVSGRISQILEGLTITKEMAQSLVGTPIHNDDGKHIGTITKIDYENDMFFGELFEDATVIFPETDKSVSVELG